MAKVKDAVVLAIALAMTGCAVTPQEFYSQRSSLGEVTLCRTYRSAAQKGQVQLAQDIQSDLRTRFNTYASQCDKIISDSENAILGGILVAAAVVAVANSGGGSGGYYPSSRVEDSDWAWDAFYNQYGSLVWRCRGIQTGQFAENGHCAYDVMTDNHWPGT